MITNFNRLTNFTGRNGYFTAKGIEAYPMHHNQTIMLTPITSKGKLARCDIQIPIENLEEVIATLEAARDTLIDTAVHDTRLA